MPRQWTAISVSLGVLLLVGASYAAGSLHLLTPAPIAADDTCQTFKETGHMVCGAFLAYWQAHGGLAQQGYPISDVFDEQSETDGKTYKVQYFERAVFEAHPENQPPYTVLLSLLGSQKYKTKYGGTQPAASASPAATAISSPTATTAASSVVATVPNASSAITFFSVMGGATGGAGSVGIKGPANTTCVLSFMTPAGNLSKASGLGSQTTTAGGIATWTWKLDADAGHGMGKVTVVCGNVSATAPITIT